MVTHKYLGQYADCMGRYNVRLKGYKKKFENYVKCVIEIGSRSVVDIAASNAGFNQVHKRFHAKNEMF
jgi:hypothetical protein